MRFEEAYEGWNAGRLTQAEAARILGVCERSSRRYMWRYETNGLDGLIDRQMEQASNRQAPVYKAMAQLSTPGKKADNPCATEPDNSKNSRHTLEKSGLP